MFKKKLGALFVSLLAVSGLGAVTAHPAQAASTSLPAGKYGYKGLPGDPRLGIPYRSTNGKTINGRIQPNTQTPVSTSFIYGNSSQGGGGQLAGMNSLAANMTVIKPYLDYTGTNGDYHSLVEMAAQSEDGQQVVELGVNVDNAVNGDTNAHIFVFHWINGNPTCYNGCGWVPYTGSGASPVAAGGTIPASDIGTSQKFNIVHSGGAWWLAYKNGWLGYFPDTEWTAPRTGYGSPVTYTEMGYVQLFGELAVHKTNPCTDMGTGVLATTTAGARIGSVTFGGTTTPVNLYVRMATAPTSFPYLGYNAVLLSGSTRSFDYGGPGADSTGSVVGTTGSC